MPYPSEDSVRFRATSQNQQDRFDLHRHSTDTDIVCFSHLRWDLVFQRPQHLLTRAAQTRRVFYVEEPLPTDDQAWLEFSGSQRGVQRVIPRLPEGLSAHRSQETLRSLVDQLFASVGIERFVAWYYTPMALAFTDHLQPVATVYDCMDELSHFKGAPPEMAAHEAALFQRADVVFTGGYSLYRAKRRQHGNVHVFPSSIDAAHFASAPLGAAGPAALDQQAIPGPRVGFCGVIDERMDIELLGRIADLRPEWQFVMIGPVVKIDPDTLPQRSNIHYLGRRPYEDLPAYLAGWDVAIMPFALNDATRYISPTKTLEYLAAGLPIVSTAITDVVHPYGELRLVGIAGNAEEFVSLCEEHRERATQSEWQRGVAAVLASTDWDRTWSQMDEQLQACLQLAGRFTSSATTSVGADV